jgi:hypothetical protein
MDEVTELIIRALERRRSLAQSLLTPLARLASLAPERSRATKLTSPSVTRN